MFRGAVLAFSSLQPPVRSRRLEPGKGVHPPAPGLTQPLWCPSPKSQSLLPGRPPFPCHPVNPRVAPAVRSPLNLGLLAGRPPQSLRTPRGPSCNAAQRHKAAASSRSGPVKGSQRSPRPRIWPLLLEQGSWAQIWGLATCRDPGHAPGCTGAPSLCKPVSAAAEGNKGDCARLPVSHSLEPDPPGSAHN